MGLLLLKELVFEPGSMIQSGGRKCKKYSNQSQTENWREGKESHVPLHAGCFYLSKFRG